MLAATLDGCPVFLSFILVIFDAPTQHFGVTQDSIHGCANFMAHTCQKLALGLVRIVSGKFRFGQFDVALFQFRDVLERGQNTPVLSVLAENRRGVGNEGQFLFIAVN